MSEHQAQQLPTVVEQEECIENDLPTFPAYEPQFAEELMIAIAEPWDASILNEAIDQFRLKGLTLREELVILTARSILHCLEHGDVHPARKLLQAAPKQQLYLRTCFVNYGPFKFDTGRFKDYTTGKVTEAKGLAVDKEKFKELKVEYLGQKGDKNAKLRFARGLVESLTVRPDKGAIEFDFLKAFKAFIKRMEAKHRKFPNDNLLARGIDQSRALLDSFGQ